MYLSRRSDRSSREPLRLIGRMAIVWRGERQAWLQRHLVDGGRWDGRRRDLLDARGGDRHCRSMGVAQLRGGWRHCPALRLCLCEALRALRRGGWCLRLSSRDPQGGTGRQPVMGAARRLRADQCRLCVHLRPVPGSRRGIGVLVPPCRRRRHRDVLCRVESEGCGRGERSRDLPGLVQAVRTGWAGRIWTQPVES